MFNGIIYNQGTITKIIKRPKGLNIFVKSNLLSNLLFLSIRDLIRCIPFLLNFKIFDLSALL